MSSDEVAIKELFANDRKRGVQTIMDMYHQPLVRVAYHLLGDSDDALDAVQQMYIKLFYESWQFDGRSSMKTFLTAIVVNICRDMLRKKNRRSALLQWWSDCVQCKEPESGSDHHALVRDALLRVPLQYRIPLQLCEWDAMKYDEIADVLKIPVNTVRSRIARGRKKLGELLVAAGVNV